MNDLIYPHVFLLSYYAKSDRPYPQNPKPESLKESLISLDKYDVKGYKIKQCLQNTNSLLLTCSLEEEEKPPRYNYFGALTKQLLNIREIEERSRDKTGEIISDRLGTTLILSGYLPSFITFNEENCQKLAQSAYENLGNIKAPTWYSPPITEQFDAKVFSLGETPSKFARETREKIEHILIFTYRDRPTFSAAIANYYEDWLELYCYRHHIVSGYRDTRQIKADIQSYYSLAGWFRDRPDYPNALIDYRLNQLEKAISDSEPLSARYIEGISRLETRKAAIQTNLNNYCEKLQTFNPSDEFSQLVNQHYLEQIERDIDTLSPGLRLQQTWLETLRGMVEIQRAKSDRNIEALIGAAGVGIGASSAAASASSGLIKDIQPNLQPTFSLAVILIGSLLFGGLLGCLTWMIVKYLRSHLSR
ncbi:MAG: hypothetical protein J7647_10890 [Cyanobacteria bacterium SBLK]|nr:hypothetical protein [Cyanobacteria bacterium SBLK]